RNKGNKYFKDLDDSILKAVKTGKVHVRDIDQLDSLRDTIMSLNPSYGAGHSKQYFSIPQNQNKEFLAHAFENRFLNNNVIKNFAPELHDDMVDLINKLLR